MSETLDIAASRSGRPYATWELLGRVAWALSWPLFRLSPRPLHGWRRLLLRLFGARIGAHTHVHNSVRVELPWNLEVGAWSAIGDGAIVYNLGPVTIGSRTTVSQRAHLCAGTHDHTRRDMPLLRTPIAIGNDAWVCAEAFVGPGVSIGDGAVVGARAVVTTDVPAWVVVAGNPARRVGRRELKPEAAS